MRVTVAIGVLAVGVSFATGAEEEEERECSWSQWGRTSAHDGAVCRDGQDARRELAELTFDPFVADEMADSGRDSLLTHYQAPLLDGNDVFMMFKTGAWVRCDSVPAGTPCGAAAWDGQIWNEKRLHWKGGKLVEKWNFASDWKPVPFRLVSGWEPMFQPALGEEVLYVPGAGGTVFELARESGKVIRRINPFATIAADTFTTGGITIDARGNVYWNVLKVDPVTPLRFDAQSWLVRADRRGRTTLVSYATLIPGAPAGSNCFLTFFARPPVQFPLPPPDNADGSPALPPVGLCGSQRAGVNVTPAVGADGTIYSVTRAHFNGAYGYVVALKPDLSLKFAASLRDRLNDGCGDLVPFDDFNFACRSTARFGVDPFTNLQPAGVVTDLSSSAPVALPDGGVLYGSFTNYNESRGHLFKFDASGAFAGSYDFGWDLTPAIWRHGRTYSVIVKDNHYGTGGPFYITQLSASLAPEWKYRSATIDADHPDGYEWCINAPAVDASGTVYGTSEDGHFYSIRQGGTVKDRVFLNLAEGAAYTPLSIDRRGRIHALNNGVMTILGE